MGANICTARGMEQSLLKKKKENRERERERWGEESGERLQEYEWNETSFGGYVIHVLLLTSVSSDPEPEQEVDSEEK